MGRRRYSTPIVLFIFLAVLLQACGPTWAPTTYLQPVKEPGIVITSGKTLSVAGSIQRGSLVSIALRKSEDPETGEAIYGIGVTAGNESLQSVKFGPDDVFLADSDRRLLPRLSEAWIADFYRNAIREREVVAEYRPVMPVYAPTYRVSMTHMRIGDTVYTTGRISPYPYAALGEGIGMLLAAGIAAGQRARALREIRDLERKRREILADLLRPTVLPPKTEISRSLYFYKASTTKLRYPLKVVIRVGSEIYLFHFNQASISPQTME